MLRPIATFFFVITIVNLSWASPEIEEKMKLQVNLDRTAFFDVELLQELTKLPAFEHNNVLLSPISVKAALGMLWEGAGPIAAEEIRQALRLPNTKDEVRSFFSAVLQSLQKKSIDQDYTLDMANRLYVTDSIILREHGRNSTNPNRGYVYNRPGSSGDRRKPGSSQTAASQPTRQNIISTTPTPAIPVIEPDFVRALTHYYGAEATFLDFSKQNEAAAVINGWASDLTHGLITNVISPDVIAPSTQLFLGNVVYFKGKWENSFDPEQSKPGNFHLLNKSLFPTTMMEQVNYFKFGVIDSLAALALELPYAGNKFSMLILLPNEKNGINQMLRDLPHNPLNSVIAQLELQEVQVIIPRFEAEFNSDVVGPLRSLGIQYVFQSLDSSLPGISKRVPMKVESIQHTVKVIVNEQGTEAAAATGVLVVPLMGGSVPKFEADHPFLFFIRDSETGAFLFGGKMSQPSAYTPGSPSTNNTNNVHHPAVKPVSAEEEALYSSVFQKDPSQPVSSTNTTLHPKQGDGYLPPSQSQPSLPISSQRRSRMAFYPGLDEDRVVFEQ